MEMKICSKCGEEKLLNQFYFDRTSSRFRSDCKSCVCFSKKSYNQRPEVKERHRIAEEERRKREDVKTYTKSYNENYKQRKNQLRRDRRKIDESFKIQENVRRRISRAFNTQKIIKDETTLHLLGCQFDFLIEWLKFTKPYFIPNTYIGELQIDHFLPINMFDLRIEEEKLKVCNWSNLRYLTAEANSRKRAKLPTPIEKFKMLVLKAYFLSLH